MAKKDEKPDEKATEQTETQTETATYEMTKVEDLREALTISQAALEVRGAELAKVQAAYDEKCAECDSLKSELAALKQNQQQPETPYDTRESVWVRSARGSEFWRGGVLFDHEWREVQRDTVGETAWVRIVTEPALQVKQAD
ncbi:hypothetical protein QG041_00805 [Kingella kingae]|uniref:hypothetical protein n=1 Tax=Kingella kingae TaxID=504 RepID=UPI0002585038|nr:hypothetical protein [Kingella kingae]DAS21768.1 MAG TPA: hypothetical protein [Caudoviricetes sp.]EIC13946.1 hypothetical protein KKB_02965 [Kingella kingae PYKK081]MDK4567857.1 hypothetical protein [Kingella kingae]MDK4569830.1 hypothetical protein [Kingella kingae]MDK4571777.1 hypothetical protein [Kingella kingae]